MLICSFGGGRDSTALLIEAARRGIRPDLILFADTGGEHPDTYEWIDTFSDWLVSHGFPPVTVVSYVNRYKQVVTLEGDCLRKGILPSISYGRKGCSHKFKKEVQERFCNRNSDCQAVWASGEKIIKWIGYEKGEERRAKIKDDRKYTYQYPLIEWGIDRAECDAIIERAGLPRVPKSSCFFCASMKKHEILRLKELYPDLLQRALEMERLAMPKLKSVKGLGRNFSWADFLSGQEDALRAAECTLDAPCGCYDGG